MTQIMEFLNQKLHITESTYANGDIITVTEQHDWMIWTWEPACNGRKGHWEQYWSICTWTKNKDLASRKARLSLIHQSHPTTKWRWKLEYKGVRTIPPMRINRLDGSCLP